MRNKMSAKCLSPLLFLVFSVLMLYPLIVVKAQVTSINLEDTQWIAKPFEMVNVDASITVITSTYYFYKQGKFKLYTFANKGVGISPVDGKLTFPFASDSEVFGTYKVEGKSVYLYFPNETITATISGNQMKGTSTLKDTNKKEEWLVEKFIPENKLFNQNADKPTEPSTKSDNSSLPTSNANSNSKSESIYAELQRQMIEESEKEKRQYMTELNKLLTYKTVAKLNYKDSVVNATILIKIKSVNEKGNFTAEIKGIKGVIFSGICTNQVFDEPPKDVDTFDFGNDSEPIKLSCRIIANVKEWGLAGGSIDLVSMAQKKFIASGQFTVIESTK